MFFKKLLVQQKTQLFEKYTTFTVAIEKQVIAINKNGKEIPQKYILQIGSY